MRTSGVERVAAVLVALEALALAVVVGMQILAIVGGDTGSIDTALALAVLTVIGAVIVAAFAIAIWQGQSWGRSGAIVAQLLLLSVAVGAATGAYAHPLTGVGIALPAVLVGGVLVASARAAARRTAHDSDEASTTSTDA